MKLPRFPRFITVVNSVATATVDTINSVSSLWSEISLAEGEKESTYRLAPYGEHPVMYDGRQVIQVVDEEAVELMASNYASIRTQLATFFQGIPVYEGHPDDPQWLKDNPGHKATAVARIKGIEKGADGPYVRTVFNSAGVGLLGGTAPSYSGHSPRWRMVPIPGRPNHYRPILLWSDGLTNNPNIPGNTLALNSLKTGDTPELPKSPESKPDESENTTDIMKLTPEALKALGFAPDATPTEAEISAAITKLASEKATAESNKVTAETAKGTAEGALTAANSRITSLEQIQGLAVTTVINSAVADGRITEADKPRWMDALNTSFATEAEKLNKLMPSINTQSRLPGGERRELAPEQAAANQANGVDAINSAVADIAKTEGLNLSVRTDYDRAHKLTRERHPELYKRG